MNYLDPALPDRFWSKIIVEPVTDCWLWAAAKDRDGYGRFQIIHSKSEEAHRVAFEALRGTIPKGLQLDHLCRTRHCVNPDHLEAVICKTNINRGLTGENNRSKTSCPQGHEYTIENTRVYRGSRYCKSCKRIARGTCS